MTICEFSGHGMGSGGRCDLEAGRSGLRTVSGRALELVIHEGRRELHRSPVVLVPGEVTRLRVR